MSEFSIFVGDQIISTGDISITDGQNKYSLYFLKTNIYSKWKSEVDQYLSDNGHSNLIVL